MDAGRKEKDAQHQPGGLSRDVFGGCLCWGARQEIPRDVGPERLRLLQEHLAVFQAGAGSL